MTSFVGSAEQMDTVHRRLGEIWLRDPYVVVLRDEGKYLLFGTTDEPPEGESAVCLLVRPSNRGKEGQTDHRIH